jgi:hypothetical protein
VSEAEQRSSNNARMHVTNHHSGCISEGFSEPALSESITHQLDCNQIGGAHTVSPLKRLVSRRSASLSLT